MRPCLFLAQGNKAQHFGGGHTSPPGMSLGRPIHQARLCSLPVLLVALLLGGPAAAAARRRIARSAHHCCHQPGCKAQAVVEQEPSHWDPGQVAHIGQGAQVDAPAAPPRAGQQLLGPGGGEGRTGRAQGWLQRPPAPESHSWQMEACPLAQHPPHPACSNPRLWSTCTQPWLARRPGAVSTGRAVLSCPDSRQAQGLPQTVPYSTLACKARLTCSRVSTSSSPSSCPPASPPPLPLPASPSAALSRRLSATSRRTSRPISNEAMGRSSGSPRYRTSRQVLLGSRCRGRWSGRWRAGTQARAHQTELGSQHWRPSSNRNRRCARRDACCIASHAPAQPRRSAPPQPPALPRLPLPEAPPTAGWPPGIAAAGAGPAQDNPAEQKARQKAAPPNLALAATQMAAPQASSLVGRAAHACAVGPRQHRPQAAGKQRLGSANRGLRGLWTSPHRAAGPAHSPPPAHLWLEDVGGDIQQVARHVGGPARSSAEQRKARGSLSQGGEGGAMLQSRACNCSQRAARSGATQHQDHGRCLRTTPVCAEPSSNSTHPHQRCVAHAACGGRHLPVLRLLQQPGQQLGKRAVGAPWLRGCDTTGGFVGGQAGRVRPQEEDAAARHTGQCWVCCLAATVDAWQPAPAEQGRIFHGRHLGSSPRAAAPRQQTRGAAHPHTC